MRKVMILLLVIETILLSSCRVIYVWSIRDIIGLCFGGLIVIVFLILLAYAWICDTIDERKFRKNKYKNGI